MSEPTTKELDEWRAFYKPYARSQGPDSAVARILRLIEQVKALGADAERINAAWKAEVAWMREEQGCPNCAHCILKRGGHLDHEHEEEDEDADVRYKLWCHKRTKSGSACRRFIVGVYDGGVSGSFEHPKLGYCDMRNSEWVCWQHQNVKEYGERSEAVR